MSQHSLSVLKPYSVVIESEPACSQQWSFFQTPQVPLASPLGKCWENTDINFIHVKSPPLPEFHTCFQTTILHQTFTSAYFYKTYPVIDTQGSTTAQGMSFWKLIFASKTVRGGNKMGGFLESHQRSGFSGLQSGSQSFRFPPPPSAVAPLGILRLLVLTSSAGPKRSCLLSQQGMGCERVQQTSCLLLDVQDRSFQVLEAGSFFQGALW